MNSKEIPAILVEKLLHSKSGPSNIKMAYTIGYLQSVIANLLEENPDAAIRLWHKVERMENKKL